MNDEGQCVGSHAEYWANQLTQQIHGILGLIRNYTPLDISCARAAI